MRGAPPKASQPRNSWGDGVPTPQGKGVVAGGRGRGGLGAIWSNEQGRLKGTQ